MSLGDELRKARMARKLTASEVAAKTRMKVQLVEALEQEDFSSMAAPIYAKGFIRLFAEAVGLNSSPLVQEYMDRFINKSEDPGVARSVLKSLEGPELEDETDAVSDVVDEDMDIAGEMSQVAEDTPAAAPEVSAKKQEKPAEGDNAEDLFTRIVDRKEKKPFQQADEPKDDLPQVRDFLKASKEKFLKEVVEPCRELWRKGIESGSARSQKLGQLIKEQSKALATRIREQFGKSPARTAVVLVAGVAILILVLSSLSNMGGSGRSQKAPGPKGAGVFTVAVDPSDPYLD